MPWERRSASGYVYSIEVFRKGETEPATGVQYYLTTKITPNPPSASDPGDQQVFALSMDIGESLLRNRDVSESMCYASILTILKEALCGEKQVNITAEKYVLPVGEYPDPMFRELMGAYPWIISVEILG